MKENKLKAITLQVVLPIIASILVLSSCEKEISENIDQNKIWMNLELKYDQSIDSSFASATFRFGNSAGSRLKLSDPSNVSFNDELLTWNENVGSYSLSFNGMVNNGTFLWTDLDGNTFSNDLEVREVAYPASIPSTLFYADSIVFFNWTGAPLNVDERMVLTLDGPGNSDTRDFPADSVGMTAIGIDSVRLSEVDSGTVMMTLKKQYRPPLQESTDKGGRLTGTYLLSPREVELQ